MTTFLVRVMRALNRSQMERLSSRTIYCSHSCVPKICFLLIWYHLVLLFPLTHPDLVSSCCFLLPHALLESGTILCCPINVKKISYKARATGTRTDFLLKTSKSRERGELLLLLKDLLAEVRIAAAV